MCAAPRATSVPRQCRNYREIGKGNARKGTNYWILGHHFKYIKCLSKIFVQAKKVRISDLEPKNFSCDTVPGAAWKDCSFNRDILVNGWDRELNNGNGPHVYRGGWRPHACAYLKTKFTYDKNGGEFEFSSARVLWWKQFEILKFQQTKKDN